jgi:hypothetical protein
MHLVLAGAMSGGVLAQTAPPLMPVTHFPGADWKSITCTPGPAVRESTAVHRQVRGFINGIQHGHVDPKTVGPAITAVDPGGVRRFFSHIGPVRTLEFRRANTACSSSSVDYSYRVVGRDASALLTFTVTRGRIEGYAQDDQ